VKKRIMKRAICITIDKTVIEQVEKLAERESRSLSAMINELLKERLAVTRKTIRNGLKTK
jgi:hypothetical protein